MSCQTRGTEETLGNGPVAGPTVRPVIGNVYPKYATRNPIARYLMHGFLSAAGELYDSTAAKTVLEVGCGEGELASRLVRRGSRPERFVACDLDLSRVKDDPLITYQCASAYALPYKDGEFDLVVCCEVLEHLDDPAAAIHEIARVSKKAALISVPWEPVWRFANVARGRYLSRFGNTPGHVQHFSRSDIRLLVGGKLSILNERRPFPWTMLLCAKASL
ncbi:MAG: class I SAM-dependent methyltransferase [Planctomycetota bacterium]|nr:class I SAM-dependent methyltransferase [Planctomycetaceae bacterium]MDQ3330332.1 class I SAM-dependent methyltransferase [Planctomycetota bacterium]